MTGIPTPHEPDDDDLIIPGPKETFTPLSDEWERVPDKPGFWRHKTTGRLTYIPDIFGVPQRP